MSAIPAISSEIEPAQVKTRLPSKRMQQALSHLAVKGVNQREAAKLAGISEFHLSRELKKPQIQMFIDRVIREKVSLTTLRASSRLGELIDCDSMATSFDATRLSLAIAGIKPATEAQVSVNVNIKAGFVIDLSEQPKQVKIIDNE